jgi:hypothetical protein
VIAALIAALFLPLGVLLGAWSRDLYWRGKVLTGTRVCAGGRFYYVAEEGDPESCTRVLQWITQDITSRALTMEGRNHGEPERRGRNERSDA